MTLELQFCGLAPPLWLRSGENVLRAADGARIVEGEGGGIARCTAPARGAPRAISAPANPTPPRSRQNNTAARTSSA